MELFWVFCNGISAGDKRESPKTNFQMQFYSKGHEKRINDVIVTKLKGTNNFVLHEHTVCIKFCGVNSKRWSKSQIIIKKYIGCRCI